MNDARQRGANDYLMGVPITRCPYPHGKDRRAWIAAWYEARSAHGGALA